MRRYDFGATYSDSRDIRTTRAYRRETGRTWSHICGVCGIAAVLSAVGSHDAIGMWILAAAFFGAALVFGFLNR